jgi:hypothetical protein
MTQINQRAMKITARKIRNIAVILLVSQEKIKRRRPRKDRHKFFLNLMVGEVMVTPLPTTFFNSYVDCRPFSFA